MRFMVQRHKRINKHKHAEKNMRSCWHNYTAWLLYFVLLLYYFCLYFAAWNGPNGASAQPLNGILHPQLTKIDYSPECYFISQKKNSCKIFYNSATVWQGGIFLNIIFYWILGFIWVLIYIILLYKYIILMYYTVK